MGPATEGFSGGGGGGAGGAGGDNGSFNGGDGGPGCSRWYVDSPKVPSPGTICKQLVPNAHL